jgi:transcriptional regulator with XRE-family HTH domain
MSPLKFRTDILKCSQRELAEKLGVSQVQVHWIEAGKRRPSALVAAKYEKLSKGKVRLNDFLAMKGAA